MPQFRFTALDAAGQRLDGVMEAADQAEVVARLQAQGQLPVEARPLDALGSASAGWQQWLRKPAFGADAQLLFTRQLATLLAAGQPLDRALGILVELPEGASAQQAISQIREVVRGGAPLSVAMERQHGMFSRLYLNMVRAGEAGGTLAGTLERLADYLERAQQLRTRVINALVYPVILLLVVGAALLFLLGYVVPQFAQMYDSLDVQLPWFTAAVLALGAAVAEWWIGLVVLPCLLVLWAGRKRHDAAFMLDVDGWLLRRRLLGPLLAQLEVARLSRTLGTLLGNGVPLLSALGIAGNVLGNRVLAADVAEATARVRDGHSLSSSLARNGHLPRLAVQMVQVGEESGALDAMLLRAADTFEAQTSRAIDRLLAAMVPAITLVLASIVGLVIVAVLVPLYDLTGAIG